MGSSPSQSIPSKSADATSSIVTTSSKASKKNIRFQTDKEEQDYLKSLTSPERAFYHCRREKKKFNKCYAKWWGVAIKGKNAGGEAVDRSDCDELLEIYQDCVLKYLAEEKERKSSNN